MTEQESSRFDGEQSEKSPKIVVRSYVAAVALNDYIAEHNRKQTEDESVSE